MDAPIFVLGTGPRVGKTLVAEGLLAALGALGRPAVGMKPVETGCAHGDDHDLVGRDGERLRAAAPTPLPPLLASPYRFAPALAPAVAAQQAGLTLTVSDLAQAVAQAGAVAPVIVEGPGGPLSPIAEDGATVDLAAALRAKVLVLSADRPGADSAVLLTLEACARRGVSVAGVLLTRRDADVTPQPHEATIRDRGGVRVFATVPTLDGDKAAGMQAHLAGTDILQAL